MSENCALLSNRVIISRPSQRKETFGKRRASQSFATPMKSASLIVDIGTTRSTFSRRMIPSRCSTQCPTLLGSSGARVSATSQAVDTALALISLAACGAEGATKPCAPQKAREAVVEADVEHAVVAVSHCCSGPTCAGVPALLPARSTMKS